MKKLSVVYYTDEGYIVPTCTSALSLVEHNLDMKIYFWLFCEDYENWTQESKMVIDSLTRRESCEVAILSTEGLRNKCNMYGLPMYKGAQGVFLKMFMCDWVPDKDCNILFLDGDTLINGSLEELADYKFSTGYCCAAMIDTMNNKYLKRMLHIQKSSTIFCHATFLVNPYLWKEYNCDALIDKWLKKISQTGNLKKIMVCIINEQGLLSKALEKQCAILPVKYMVLPGNAILSNKYRNLLFGMRRKEYYRKQDVISANNYPVIIHYMHYIVQKPWKHDKLNKYERLWLDTYEKVNGHEAFPITEWKMNRMERIKRWLVIYCPILFALAGRAYLKHYIKTGIKYCDSLHVFED